ncbi:MAG: cbb3-type cytochrome oxidase assembly protein CcoS [Desulfuromonadales bacterium]|jgi:cbb3-type cytochrome oxidase maturation protein
MLQSTLILIILSLFLGAGVWLVFLWAVRKGEFDDMEGPKHRMLEEDADFPQTGPGPGVNDDD